MIMTNMFTKQNPGGHIIYQENIVDADTQMA